MRILYLVRNPFLQKVYIVNDIRTFCVRWTMKGGTSTIETRQIRANQDFHERTEESWKKIS